MKQKTMSVREEFTVKNADERDVYFVEGSFIQVPKTFAIDYVKSSQAAASASI